MKKTASVIVFFLFSTMAAIAQCPMCRSSVESSMKDGSKSVGMGLNAGILFMLAVVYLCVFVVGALWYMKYRKFSRNNVQ